MEMRLGAARGEGGGVFYLGNPDRRGGGSSDSGNPGGRGGGFKNDPIRRECVDFFWNNTFS